MAERSEAKSAKRSFASKIKIVDFGLARKIEAGERFCCMNGTRGYMAPEQLSFNNVFIRKMLLA